MDKIHKSSNKTSKNKKNQPLKVVYIGNPIKFKASVSEFRALVQELTGQDSDISDAAKFVVADQDVMTSREDVTDHTVKVVAEESSTVQHEVTKLGFNSTTNDNGHGEVINGSSRSIFGLYDDVFRNPEMIDNFPWSTGGF